VVNSLATAVEYVSSVAPMIGALVVVWDSLSSTATT